MLSPEPGPEPAPIRDDAEHRGPPGARGSRGDRRPRWALIGALAWAAVVAAGIGLVTALAWRDGLLPVSGVRLAAAWAAFMAQVFTFHLGVACAGELMFALAARRKRLAITAGLFAAVGLGPHVMETIGRGRAVTGSGPTLTMMSANLMYGRHSAAKLLAQIDRVKPDVLLVQEWTPLASASIGPALRGRFAHAIESPRDDAFGQAVFSTKPFRRDPRLFPPVGAFSEAQIAVEVDLGGRPVRIVNVHLLPPAGPGMFAAQREGARWLAAWCGDEARDDRPHVLMGDFNATIGTSVVSRIAGETYREAHVAAGLGRGSTWPRTGFLRHFPGIRLDNALVAGVLAVLEARTGEDFGSDHRPVIVKIGWKK